MTRNSKILSLLLLILPFSIYSQSELQYCNEINNKKLEKSFEKAADLYLNGELEEAELILAKVVDEEPEFTEAWAIIAELNYSRYKSATNSKAKSNNFSNYIKCLEKIVETCPKYNDYSVNYSLGKIYFDNEDFEQARKYLNQFILNTSKRDANYDDSQNLLKYIEEYQQIVLNPVPFQPIIVEGVSTINDDYLPIISPDGSLAFFTHAFMKKDINSIYGEKFTEEFAVARAVDESGTKFSSGTPLPYPFNMGRN
ncbi:MAG TPA: hypothetical protein PLL66_09020, partial [Bacteroidales bacterium]|nr:hypothetical protein [Bacteroidales bacterium]